MLLVYAHHLSTLVTGKAIEFCRTALICVSAVVIDWLLCCSFSSIFCLVMPCVHIDDVRLISSVTCVVQEAGMMASMRHPNVVMYLGVCLQPPCVVTEYCARGSLNDVFKRARATPALAAQLDWGRRCVSHPLQTCRLLVGFCALWAHLNSCF